MLKNLAYFNTAQRRFFFFLIFGGGLLLLVALTWALINQAFNTGRDMSVAVATNVTVREFAVLPDDDAYPPAVAAASDGMVYTGSFATGAVWAITPDGVVTEIPNTRDAIGAVIGLAVAPDGALIVIDQLDTDPRSGGGKVWRVDPTANTVTELALDAEAWSAPDDAAFDSAGRLYISDAGSNQVWRFDADGSGGAVWWVPPVNIGDPRHAVRGLAFDPINNAMIITDPEVDTIYRVPVDGGDTEIVYRHGDREFAPGFDGVTVAPDGTIYVAALAQKGVARVEDGDLDYIAGMFRNPSDVDYAAPGLLYVPNFDQSSLVLPFDAPQLPFGIDVIDLTMSAP